jgi:hypothetical protein
MAVNRWIAGQLARLSGEYNSAVKLGYKKRKSQAPYTDVYRKGLCAHRED